MQTDQSQLRSIVNECFAARSLAGLLTILGFSPRGLPVAGLEFDAALHGTRGTLACYVLRDVTNLAASARALRARNYAELQLYVATRADFADIVVGSFGFGEKLLTLTLQRDRIHASDLEALQEMLPLGDEGSALAARHARALDRGRVSRRFFADFAAQRNAVAAAWTGAVPRRQRDREQLALLLLSRLMFLYFLQHRGYLANDRSYLVRRFHEWRGRRTFFAGALEPLFFHVLNRRPERRPARAAAFGELPYLNGGLFERHPLERKHSRIDLPNAVLASVFNDLLERYRFTAREAAEAQVDGVHDVGVDPEMLGRVFEGLMAERVRETTGTFYTPAATVDRLVCDTMAAYLEKRPRTIRVLKEVRVLDPACGSGAFLLGALSRVAEQRALLEGTSMMDARRDVVARSLYGVDLQSDAALLCALRLWLALVPGDEQQTVQPLPNLDRHIRQGDSLVDPLDLRAGATSGDVRRCIAELQPAGSAYVHSEPEQRPLLQQTLARAEHRLARAWVSAQQQRLAYRISEARAAAQEKDLFGAVTADARHARADFVELRERLAELRTLSRGVIAKGETPFFSFAVHFADAALAGFDVVLCNPPWVRSHNWPRSVGALVKRRFRVCADGNQVDLALLFLERAIDLLAPGGALGIILPAKFMRSLAGAAARRLLLERTDIVSIEDHSLDQRSIFNADAFASLIVARKRVSESSDGASPVRIRMVRRGIAPLDFAAAPAELSLVSADPRSPWLIIPPEVRKAIARMREGPAIGEQAALRIRRGVVSGMNGVMVLTSVARKLGGLAEVRSEGAASAVRAADFEGVIEECAIARLVRGCDLRPWSFETSRHLLARRVGGSDRLPRLEKYLRRHNLTLADVPKIPAGHTAVAWHDLASSLNAVVLPAPVVALNTVYFIEADEEVAHLLCAYFNSLPVRTFARAIAERAKDAHFRFFAWTIAMLSLPACWRSFEARRLIEISECCHADGSTPDVLDELDQLVGRAYQLTRADMRALAGFDAWLRGS